MASLGGAAKLSLSKMVSLFILVIAGFALKRNPLLVVVIAGLVSGIAAVLKDSGIAIIEVPYVKDLIDRCEFDTIYHEHLCYFSATACCANRWRHSRATTRSATSTSPAS